MSSPFWLILILGLFLQAGGVWIGPDAPEAASDSPAAIACSACEANACGCCDQTGCTAAASSSEMASSCECGETPSSLPVDSAPPPPSRPVGSELAAGPVWTEVRQNILSPSRGARHPFDVPFGGATGAVVEPPVALTVRFCAFLI
jgi:hypothetical protein